MAEHDDELDRRITELLGLAQNDAPVPDEATLPRRRRTGRWIAVAAAVALVGVGVGVLALRDDPETVAPTDTSSPRPITTLPTSDTSTATASSIAPSTTVGRPRDCGGPAVDSYDTVGSMHTVVPSSQPLDISIRVLDGPWCPGGTGQLQLSVTNIGVADEVLDLSSLILSGGMNKYQLALTLPPGASPTMLLAPGVGWTSDFQVTVPAAPPGSYAVYVYGFDSGAEVNLAGPTACDTVDLAAVAAAGDRIDGQEITSVTVTNAGDSPCFLGKPLTVMATAPDGTTTASPIPFDRGGFFILDDPRPSRVLEPGGSTVVVLTTPTNCPESTTPTYWSQMQLWTGPQGNSNVVIDLGPENRVHTECGLALSGWAAPSAPG